MLYVVRNGQPLPCAFASRCWHGAERSWTVVRREAKALRSAIERFHVWVRMDDSVRYEVDSPALTAILRHPDVGFLAKVGMALSKMSVKDNQIVHISDEGNKVADWSSRDPTPDSSTYFTESLDPALAVLLSVLPTKRSKKKSPKSRKWINAHALADSLSSTPSMKLLASTTPSPSPTPNPHLT